MICKNAEEIIKSASIESILRDRLRQSFRVARGVGRGAFGAAKIVGKGALGLGNMTASAVEKAGDFIMKRPVTALAASMPIGYAAYHANDIVDRQLNNINPRNPYIDSWRRPNYDSY